MTNIQPKNYNYFWYTTLPPYSDYSAPTTTRPTIAPIDIEIVDPSSTSFIDGSLIESFFDFLTETWLWEDFYEIT